MSHKGRQYPQVNRRWLSPHSVVPFFAPMVWDGEYIWGITGIPFVRGVHGETSEGDADPMAMTIKWDMPFTVDGPGVVTLTQSLFTGAPRIELKIRVQAFSGPFVQHIYTRPSPFNYHNLLLRNGDEDSRSFSAPFDGSLSFTATAKPWR